MEEKGKIALVAIVIAAGAFLGGLLSGYGIFSNQSNQINLKISGSTTVYPIATDAAAVFMNLYPQYNVIISAGGSGVGIANVGNGTSNIGMSSRTLTSTDYTSYPKLNATAIARDGIAIIISTKNSSMVSTVTQLTTTQVKKIYNGTYTDWNQVGGPTHAIDVYERESGSGTRSTFESMVMGSTFTYVTGIQQANGSPLMNSSVAGDAFGIGYIGIGFLQGNTAITALKIANATSPYVACTSTTVKAGTYPLSRLLFMITNGPATDSELAFLNFMVSPLGQAAVVREGFVTLV